MSSIPKQSVQINNSEHGDEETQDQEHLDVVQSSVSLFQANKIDKRNVWNVALIDVFEALVRNHHAYVSDFRNVGIYLEAAMKIYEVRVDSVHHDVRRLCYGSGGSVGNVSNSTNESVVNYDKNCDESPIKNGLKKRQRKKRIQNMNIAGSRQINAPLSLIALSDDLSYRLNKISGDISDSKRLFTTVLPTKNSLLQLFSREKFINNRVIEPIEFRDDCMYENYEDVTLPIDLLFSEKLPIRQMLSGYRLQNTPMHETEDDEEEDVDMFFEQNDIEQEYAFDASVQPDQVSVSNIFADQMNNNLNDASKRDDLSRYDDIENEEVISVNNISKGEYSYRVVDHIRNYWAGPSYWKFSLNRLSVQSAKPKLRRAQTRRLKIQPEKASFIGDHSTDTESDNEVFIKVNSRAAGKIRQVNYTLWLPEKLKLPQKVNLPDDLFGFYKYEPSFDIFGKRNSVETISIESLADNDDFSEMFENSPGDGFDDNMIDMELEPFALNISENCEDVPQAVENIQIAFDKRAKQVNMPSMIKQTEISIDRQLLSTAANESAQNLDAAEPLQPGKAMFSRVFKDLQDVWKKFLKSKSDLTTALVQFAILHVANNQRLRLKKHSIGNDFDIFQLKIN